MQHDKTMLKKLLFVVASLFCLLAITYILCTQKYTQEQKNILSEQERIAKNWVESSLQGMDIWINELNNSAKRISTSELYRSLVREANLLSSQEAALINELDTGAVLNDEKLVSFTAKVPALRNGLQEFINYNGFLVARVVNRDNVTLISSSSHPRPLSSEQQKIVQEALTTRKISFGAVRASETALLVDYAVPIMPFSEDHRTADIYNFNGEPLGAVVLTVPIRMQLAHILAHDVRQNDTIQAYILQENNNVFEHLVLSMPEVINVVTPVEVSSESVLNFTQRATLDHNFINHDKELKPLAYSYAQKIPHMQIWLLVEIPAHLLNKLFSSLAFEIYSFGFTLCTLLVLLVTILFLFHKIKKAKEDTTHLKAEYSLMLKQRKIYDNIASSFTVGVFLLDSTGKVEYYNPAFLDIVEKDDDSMKNATLMSLFAGNIAGLFIEQMNILQANKDKNVSFEIEFNQNIVPTLYRVTMYPFKGVNSKQITTVTMTDITEYRAKAKAKEQHQELIQEALIKTIESIDPYLTGHSQMIRDLSILIAEYLKLSKEDIEIVRTAASFSQVGKVFIPCDILAKAAKLNEEEQEIIKDIPNKTYELLSSIPFASPVALAVREIYEYIDGTGYPLQLRGNEIMIYSRIIAITNAFCALIHDRAFRNAYSIPEALEILQNNSSKYDPIIVDMLTKVLRTAEGKAIVLKDF